jgi:hypothetical protein
MDLVATDGQSQGGWPFSGGVRPAGDGRRPHSASEVSLDSYAGRVCEVLAANSEPAVVVGHSMAALSQRKEPHDVPNVSRRSYT